MICPPGTRLSTAAKARTLTMLYSQLKIGLCAISGWMAVAS